MLDRVRYIGYRAGLEIDKDLRFAFNLASSNARHVIGSDPVTSGVGSPADLIVADARHIPEAVVSNPRRFYVFKAGKLVVRDGALLQ